METIKKTILHLTPFFSPNIGGVETHLTDLVTKLDSLSYQNLILTYSPITTPNTPYQTHQRLSPRSQIRRFPWFGHNLFHRLEKQPFVNLFYITPYLLLRSFLHLLVHRPQIDTIHSHGINAALIGLVLVKIFNIKNHLVSIYSTYDNVNPSPQVTSYMATILNSTDQVLTQSQQSIKQLKKMGVKKVDRYRHWVDLDRFHPNLKNKKNKKFTVLFFCRMIAKKGAFLLAQVARQLPLVQFNFIGTGPDFDKIKKLKQKNIKLLGNIPYPKLHRYYQSSHLLVVPSLYQEGWGRVAMESIACGTPVVASRQGGLTELLHPSVSTVITPTQKNFHQAIEKFLKNKKFYKKTQKKCRPYAIKNFSGKNIKLITKYY